jgi:hypothetical protein
MLCLNSVKTLPAACNKNYDKGFLWIPNNYFNANISGFVAFRTKFYWVDVIIYIRVIVINQYDKSSEKYKSKNL